MLAKELVALRPDVILSNASPATGASQRETSVIPIVFTGVADPIGSGFVAGLARPGSNITGFLLFEASITGKWLAMLREVAPDLARAALVINPKSARYYEFYLRAARAAASSLWHRVLRRRPSTMRPPRSSRLSQRLPACRMAPSFCRRIATPIFIVIS